MSTPAGSALRQKFSAIEQVLVTPSVRYSRPGLQAQIQYLYGAASSADQRVPRDAVTRYTQLKRELAAVKADIAALQRMP